MVNRYIRNAFIGLVSVLCVSSASAQHKFPANKADQAVFEDGDSWLNQDDFKKALGFYESLLPNYTVAPLLHYRIGFCYMHLPEGWDKALEYFTLADNGSLDKTDFSFYYGQVLHHHLRFEKAIGQFNMALAAKKLSKDLKAEAKRYIAYCQTGITLTTKPTPVIITNIGTPVNTDFSEYVPLISSDESVLIYTYRGEKSNGGLQPTESGIPGELDYFEDIMMTLKDTNGGWIEPYHLDYNINSGGNDACVALSSDAQEMFMFRSIGNDPGSIYRSELDGLTWSDPELVEGELNSPEWDGSVTISHDGKTAYFASERKGGRGQRDLYRARKLANGKWGKIKNLGDKINTAFNEDAPFLHPSGRYLIFSSDGHETMGGYDIFVSELQPDSSWGPPVNIGYPINSPDNDKFYTISADGRHGYFASSKTGGMGKFDIYMVEPGLAERPILLAQVRGKITLNGEPVMARIDVQDISTGITLYSVTSNSYTGKYLVDLPAGVNYRITYDVGGFPIQLLEVNTVGLQEFREIIHNVNFGIETNVQQKDTLPQKDTGTTTNLNPNTLLLDSTLKTIRKTDLMRLEHPKLVYRVQIGAYRYPWNFKYQHVMNLGKKDEKEKLMDEITRFTLGRFNTLQDAYNFRDRVIKAGIGDTFVTAIYDNKRYLLTDLGPMLYEVIRYEQAMNASRENNLSHR